MQTVHDLIKTCLRCRIHWSLGLFNSWQMRKMFKMSSKGFSRQFSLGNVSPGIGMVEGFGMGVGCCAFQTTCRNKTAGMEFAGHRTEGCVASLSTCWLNATFLTQMPTVPHGETVLLHCRNNYTTNWRMHTTKITRFFGPKSKLAKEAVKPLGCFFEESPLCLLPWPVRTAILKYSCGVQWPWTEEWGVDQLNTS